LYSKHKLMVLSLETKKFVAIDINKLQMQKQPKARERLAKTI
jgi:hypothetical protein